jgi:hypothetical protein
MNRLPWVRCLGPLAALAAVPAVAGRSADPPAEVTIVLQVEVTPSPLAPQVGVATVIPRGGYALHNRQLFAVYVETRVVRNGVAGEVQRLRPYPDRDNELAGRHVGQPVRLPVVPGDEIVVESDLWVIGAGPVGSKVATAKKAWRP